MKFNFFYILQALPGLLKGAIITIELSLAAMALSLAIATIFTMGRRTGSRIIGILIDGYISFIRGTPSLVLIFLVYYVLPKISWEMPPLTAGVIALGLSSAAFTTEIFRGGLAIMPPGEIQAAEALGLHRWMIWVKIIVPQTFAVILSPLINEFTQLVKTTPLVSVITVVETMRVAQQLYNKNYHPLEVLLGAAIVFMAINMSIVKIGGFIERRIAWRVA